MSLWSEWGLNYPVTYVFDVAGIDPSLIVLCSDGLKQAWRAIPIRDRSSVFNGVECVRLDTVGQKAYVSVGFGTENILQLRFLNARTVEFDRVAEYYDGRQAAYTLSNDNWGRKSSANPGAPWQGMTDSDSDKYQASVHATRRYGIPQSIAINSEGAGIGSNAAAMWQNMQDELASGAADWEPAVHSRTHPCSKSAYEVNGYEYEITGCKEDILANLDHIPYGQYVFEFILPCGFYSDDVAAASAGEFLFLRAWSGSSHPQSTGYTDWNSTYDYYGVGGYETVSYDSVFQSRSPGARYYAGDVQFLNDAFDKVYDDGGIFYAMFHADRYSNSVIYDTTAAVDGVSGSSFMRHLEYVSGRPDVWYVANGWLYSYRITSEHASVSVPVSIKDEPGDLPRSYELVENYPNPFNATTTISYTVQYPGQTDIDIYNTSGELVRTLFSGYMPSGEHGVVWDGTTNRGESAATGLYIVRIAGGGSTASGKMLLVK